MMRNPEFTMLPPQTGPAPTLLLLALTGEETLRTDPYRQVGQLLHAQGWNVVSLDLPCHGADRRANEPPELEGWAARTRKGEHIVPPFRARVNDVLAYLIQQQIADPARIAAAGTSRGGYLAFHAAAGIPEIKAVAAFGPLADPLVLTEFAGLAGNVLTPQLALDTLATQLADRAAWITIGNHDERVGTDSVIAFSRALVQAAVQRGLPPRVTLHVLPTPGHSSDLTWHVEAAAWLQSVFPTLAPATTPP